MFFVDPFFAHEVFRPHIFRPRIFFASAFFRSLIFPSSIFSAIHYFVYLLFRPNIFIVNPIYFCVSMHVLDFRAARGVHVLSDEQERCVH